MSAILLAAWTTVGFALPAPQYADTEVATNVAISVTGERFAAMHFQLDFIASASNNVEVLVGCDANADGDLSQDEASVTFGYDAGAWFRRETTANRVTETVAPSDGRRLVRDFKFVRSAVAPDWNLAKVVRRGPVPINEWIRIERENKYFRIHIR